MQKNGIKNFVCSFVLSMLAVTAADKIIFCTPKTENEPVKKSDILPNISLFTAKTVFDAVPPDVDASPAGKVDFSSLNPIVNNTAEVEVISIPAVNFKYTLGQAHALVLDEETDEAEEIVYVGENTEDLAIPLEQGDEYSSKNIESGDFATQTQIRRKSSYRTVADNFVPDDDLSEINLKKNFSLPETPEPDSPWVIARANRYAKNRLAVEAFSSVKPEPTQATESVTLTNSSYPLPEEVSDLPAVEPAAAEEVAEATPEADPVLPVNENAAAEALEPIVETASAENIVYQPEEDVNEADNDSYDIAPLIEVGPENVKIVSEAFELNAPAADVEQVTSVLKPKILQVPDDASLLAYKMIQNLIIPIPEDIMNDADLTPQLSYSPDGNGEAAETDEKLSPEEQNSGLFKSIASWFSHKNESDNNDQEGVEEAEETIEMPKQSQPIQQTKKPKRPLKNKETPPQQANKAPILPAELKLSFQPNRAEISGQTLQWIRAFADNARDNDDVYIEVRVDGTSSRALQKKRLTLLSTILADRGVDFRKINIIFTSREANSLIIRNIRLGQNQEGNVLESVLVPQVTTYY